MPPPHPKKWTLPLRAWQKAAARSWWEQKKQNFLIEACPGAGKTLFASCLAHTMIVQNLVEQLIFVVPRESLKRQTASAMAAHGIQLDPDFKNSVGRLARDYHGAVITYQQMAFAPEVYKKMMVRPTTVFLDEVHHAGDASTWGEALHKAFDNAKYRIAMSGTPFRSDGTTIPFVEYENDISKSDYQYSYEDALREGVCRPVIFPVIGGQCEWISTNGDTVSASFDDELKKQHQSERLRTALTQETWIGDVIHRAHKTLLKVRENHPDAGGLIIAMKQQHANDIADFMCSTLGVRPPVVVSDDDGAGANIKKFAKSREPWLVSVNMVSEGVDIPRLRVGIYASNIKTPMYFRQVTGRFVRVQPGLSVKQQRSYLYIPDDPDVRKLAENITSEVVVGLAKRKSIIDRLIDGGSDSATAVAMIASGAVDENGEIIVSSDGSTPATASAADSKGENGESATGEGDGRNESLYQGLSAISQHVRDLSTTPHLLTAAAHHEDPLEHFEAIGRHAPPKTAEVSEEDMDPLSLAEKKEKIREEITTLVNKCARQFNLDQKSIHAKLNNRHGGLISKANFRQLEGRKKSIESWLNRASAPVGIPTS